MSGFRTFINHDDRGLRKVPLLCFLDRQTKTNYKHPKQETDHAARTGTTQPNPQEIRVTRLVAEQAIPAMQQALIKMLHELPTPITITKHQDPKHRTSYYTYQVGEQTAEHPHGLAMGATPNFLDAIGFSLAAAMQPKSHGKQEQQKERFAK